MKTTMERAHPTGQPIRLSKGGGCGLDAGSLKNLLQKKEVRKPPTQLGLQFFRSLVYYPVRSGAPKEISQFSENIEIMQHTSSFVTGLEPHQAEDGSTRTYRR